MRARLLTTLIASLVLHLALVGGIVFSMGHGGKTRGAARAQLPMTRMILVPPINLSLPEKSVPIPLPAVSVSSAKPGSPASLVSSDSLPAQKPLALVASKPAAEANPNAHLPAPAPEAILNPTPPPVLDASHGVVFLLDVSGSMYEPYAGSTRLTCARQVLSARVRGLKNGTPFAVVIYAQTASASGPLVAASESTREAAIRYILRDVDCGGGTNLPAGFAAAQKLHTGDIVLLTDGDLNTTAQALSLRARDILGDGQHGPSLEIFGIAPRSTENAEQLLQALAAEKDGTYQDAETETATGLLSMRTKVPSP